MSRHPFRLGDAVGEATHGRLAQAAAPRGFPLGGILLRADRDRSAYLHCARLPGRCSWTRVVCAHGSRTRFALHVFRFHHSVHLYPATDIHKAASGRGIPLPHHVPNRSSRPRPWVASRVQIPPRPQQRPAQSGRFCLMGMRATGSRRGRCPIARLGRSLRPGSPRCCRAGTNAHR